MIVGVDCFAYCHAKVSGWVQSKGLRAINNKKDINTLALAAYNRGVFAIAPILRQIRSKIDKHELNPTSEAIMNEIKRNLPAETRNHSRKIWKEYAKR